jgi:hypothetical protein
MCAYADESETTGLDRIKRKIWKERRESGGERERERENERERERRGMSKSVE